MSETVVVPREPNTGSAPLETVAMRVGEGGPAFDLAHRLGVYAHWDHVADVPVYRRWQIDAIEAWLNGEPWPRLAAASSAPMDEPKPAEDLVERLVKQANSKQSIEWEAARAIVAERKKVEELGAKLFIANSDKASFTWEVNHWHDRAEAANFRNRVLSETVDRLRTALEPFGKIDLSNAPGTQVAISNAGGTYGYLYLVDFAAARTALEQS